MPATETKIPYCNSLNPFKLLRRDTGGLSPLGAARDLLRQDEDAGARFLARLDDGQLSREEYSVAPSEDGHDGGRRCAGLPRQSDRQSDTVIASIFNSVTESPRVEPDPELPKGLPPCEPVEVATYRERFDEIKQMLVANRALALLYIDTSRLSQMEQDYGSRIYEDVLQLMTCVIMEMRGKQTRLEDIVTVYEKYGDVFLIFLSRKREESSFGRGDLENLTDRIQNHLSKRIQRLTYSYLRMRPKVTVGYGLVLHNPLIKEERLILKLIDEARKMSQLQIHRTHAKNKGQLQEIILREDVRTVFQPIVNMQDRTILGYEALSRGPSGTEFESPYMLFDVALESDLLFELDQLCRRRSLMAASELGEDHKLFINTLPMTIRDPEFQGKLMIEFLESMQLSPSRIVLEITERLAIENYAIFLEAMSYFTSIGFSMAVDDMGAGYSELEKIVHLKPNYLKFDLQMVRDIDTSFVKREMLKAFLSLANNVGAQVIAEGIETPRELETLLDLGIVYGQGFLFAKPQPAFIGQIELAR